MNRKLVCRRFWASLAGAAAVACIAPGAVAAHLGGTFYPDAGSCPGNLFAIQEGGVAEGGDGASSHYSVASSDGVLTSWSHQAGDDPPERLRLKVVRHRSGFPSRVVAESAVESPVANTMNTYPLSPAIPVRVHDQIAMFSSPGDCADLNAESGFTRSIERDDPEVGTTFTMPDMVEGVRIDISATLESDIDGDGLGDSSQDADDDGDGVEDTRDSCPRTAAKGPHGCPVFTRSLSLGYAKTAKAFRGLVFTSRRPGEDWPYPSDKCNSTAWTDQRVAVWKVRSGADRKLGMATMDTVPGNSNYGFYQLDKPYRSGKYYSKVARVFMDGVGTCSAAQSPVLTLK